MVERWMKERAAKSFGGPCMCKFVQENERKRIMRLKNMKSSIVKMSSNKHDNWTQNKIEKRHRELKKQSGFDATDGADECKSQDGHPDFDLCFRPIVDTTKSGLKLRLADNSEARPTYSGSKRIPTLREMAEDKEENNNHRPSGTIVGKVPLKKKGHDGNEGKENQSPSLDRLASNSKDSKSCRQSLRRLDIRKAKSTTTSIGTKGTTKHSTSPNDGCSHKDNKVQNQRKRLENRKFKQIKDTEKIPSVGKMAKKALVLQKKKSDPTTKKSQDHKVQSNKFKKTRMKSSFSKKGSQLHANRGVSLDALSKERLEALTILEELDSGPSWGRKRMENMGNNTGFTDNDRETLEKYSFSPRTQNMLMKNNKPVGINEMKSPILPDESKTNENLSNTESLRDHDDLLYDDHISNEEMPLSRGEHGDHDDKNNYLDKIHSHTSLTSFVDTRLLNASTGTTKEIDDFDGNNPTPTHSSLAKDKSEDFIKEEFSSYHSFRSENVLGRSLSDSSLKSVTVDLNEVIHKEISEQTKLNQYSDSGSSVYSENFESEVNPFEYGMYKNQDMNVFGSQDHDNHEGENYNKLTVDDVGSRIERNHNIDWAPRFEAESFFLPINNCEKEN